MLFVKSCITFWEVSSTFDFWRIKGRRPKHFQESTDFHGRVRSGPEVLLKFRNARFFSLCSCSGESIRRLAGDNRRTPVSRRASCRLSEAPHSALAFPRYRGVLTTIVSSGIEIRTAPRCSAPSSSPQAPDVVFVRDREQPGREPARNACFWENSNPYLKNRSIFERLRLGCIDANFQNQILVGKLLTRK